MAQSKFEVHLQILKAVTQCNPAKQSKIAAQTKNAADVAKQSLTFLSNQGLIEANQSGSFQMTRRGLAVLKHFGLIEEQAMAIENY